MKKILHVVALASTLVVLGCASGGAVRKSPDADNENALNAIRSLTARESSGLKSVQAGGDLKISVLSKGRPQGRLTSKSGPKQYELTVPIGASQDVSCSITEDMSSPAVIVKTVFDSIHEVAGIASVGIRTIEADIFKNLGYIYLEAEYLTRDKKYGTAKILASSGMNVSFYCTHDEVGYKKTFLKVVDSLVRTPYIQNQVRSFSGYDKKQIDIFSVNKLDVGYAESYQFSEEKKMKRALSFSTILLPRTRKELMTSDSVDRTVYDQENGRLLTGKYYSYDNNEEQRQIEFSQIAPRRYQVQGVLQGQKFSKTFESQQPLVYSGFLLDQYPAGSTSKKEWDFEEYVPLSPSKPTRSRIVLKEKLANGHKKVEYSFDTARAVLEMDEKSYTRMDLDMGNVSFLIRRKLFEAR